MTGKPLPNNITLDGVWLKPKGCTCKHVGVTNAKCRLHGHKRSGGRT